MKNLNVKDEKLKNWNLEHLLQSWKQGWINEPIILAEESPDQQFAIAYKNIFEYAMGGYKGHLVLLEGPDKPKVALEIKGMCPNHVQGFRHFVGKYLVAIFRTVRVSYEGPFYDGNYFLFTCYHFRDHGISNVTQDG